MSCLVARLSTACTAWMLLPLVLCILHNNNMITEAVKMASLPLNPGAYFPAVYSKQIGMVFKVGGLNKETGQNFYSNNLFGYNLTSNAWNSWDGEANVALGHRYAPFGGIVQDRYIIVVGGRTANDVLLSDCQVFDVLGTSLAKGWIACPGGALSAARYAGTSVVADDTLYLMGGKSASSSQLAFFISYNYASSTWNLTLSDYTNPYRFFANSAASEDGAFLYLLGGCNFNVNNECTSSLERYEIATDTWSALASSPLRTSYAASAISNDRMFTVYGWNGTATNANTLVYNIDTNFWDAADQHALGPLPRDGIGYVFLDDLKVLFTMGGFSDASSINCNAEFFCQYFNYFDVETLTYSDDWQSSWTSSSNNPGSTSPTSGGGTVTTQATSSSAGSLTTEEPGGQQTDDNSSGGSDNTALIVATLLIVCLLCCVLILVAVLMVYMKRTGKTMQDLKAQLRGGKAKKEIALEANEMGSSTTDVKLVNRQQDSGASSSPQSSFYATSNSTKFGNLEELQADITARVPKSTKVFGANEIRVVKRLGAGHFGEVFKGITCQENAPVALKCLRSNADMTSFVSESSMSLMISEKSHANIVKCLGLFFGYGSPESVYFSQKACAFLVLEFLGKGSLLEYLREQDDNFSLTVLGYYAFQGASGLEFLHQHQIIHRDVACRNFLLSDEGVVKIADFGLANDRGDDYYYGGSDTAVPVRWASPESLIRKKFSLKTDVFAFGVFLFELFTMGGVPYRNLSNQQIIEMANDLPSVGDANLADEGVHSLIESCCQKDASKRPTMASVSQQLSRFVSNYS